jgi:hypothetical protein
MIEVNIVWFTIKVTKSHCVNNIGWWVFCTASSLVMLATALGDQTEEQYSSIGRTYVIKVFVNTRLSF